MPSQKNKRTNPSSEESGSPALRVSSGVIPKINPYYLRISKRYRAVQILLILGILAYVLVIFGAFGQHITYSNLQYLMRDLDSMMTREEGEFTRIDYSKQSEPNFAVFKNGLAAAGKETFTLFDSTGLELCRDRINFGDPVLVPSEKYLLLYDLGGTEYAVYNSLTRVISRTADHKIVDGDMSDSGDFILVTRSNLSKYEIQHYNSALNFTMRIRKDNYVMDAAISKDGKRIVVCSAVPSVTNLDCEIALYKTGDSEFTHTVTLPDTLPLSVHFAENSFIVLCDNGVYFYDKDGNEIASTLFNDISLAYADLTDHYTVLAASENALGTENRIIVFDSTGTLLAEAELSKRLTGLCAPTEKDTDTFAYVLVPNTVLRLCAGNDETEGSELIWESADTEIPDIIVLKPSKEGVLAFTDTAAYYLFP